MGPRTPYLAAMKAVPADKAYDVFLEQRKTFGKSPAFYLDCADYLERVGQHDLAVRVLTDVAALQAGRRPAAARCRPSPAADRRAGAGHRPV